MKPQVSGLGFVCRLGQSEGDVEKTLEFPDLLRLIQRRDALVGEVEELKKRRLMMPELEYDALLEKLLIELALISRDIRNRT